ncbi:MAG: hypothetical protein MJ078_00275 [Clostridia bacterium]|nr:hypothetical protein [Clostridia bacterium]
MKFFKENTGVVIKLFVNQIGMTIFGLVLTMATVKIGMMTLYVSLFSILFYLFLIYTAMWEQGAKDAIKVEAGRLKKDSMFGFKAGFWAAVPNFFGAFLLLIFYLFGYLLTEGAWAQEAFGVMNIILPLFQAMYVGLFSAVREVISVREVEYGVTTLLYVLSSLPMMLVSMGAYVMGLKNRHFFSKKTR